MSAMGTIPRHHTNIPNYVWGQLLKTTYLGQRVGPNL
jgi:hypothetical protein